MRPIAFQIPRLVDKQLKYNNKTLAIAPMMGWTNN